MITFVNTFMSYLMLLLVIVAVAGVAIFIGINLAKAKNRKNNIGNIENTTKDE